MQNANVRYNRAELKRQWGTIAASRRLALWTITAKSHTKTTGLTESDPPELWSFALAKSEPRRSPLSEQQLKRTKAFTESIRRLNPEVDADEIYKAGQKLRATLDKVTLRETVQSLATSAKNDSELAEWLAKLLDLHRRPPITTGEYHEARADANLTTYLLVHNWIQDPPGESWATASLCFFSDRAMAKLVYFLSLPPARRQWLPLDKWETETERIGKLYERLELVPAKPRLVRDVKFKFGKIQYIPYKRAVWKGH